MLQNTRTNLQQKSSFDNDILVSFVSFNSLIFSCSSYVLKNIQILYSSFLRAILIITAPLPDHIFYLSKPTVITS